MNHAVNCRICKRDLIVNSDDECPPEWAEKLLPMLTCNRCFDLRAQREEITEKLHRICIELCNAKYLENHASAAAGNQLREKMRPAVERLLQAYMKVMAEHRNLSWTGDCADFVSLIIEKPDKLDFCLRFVRHNFHKYIAEHSQHVL